MRASVVIHQQISQLRWHMLACLGLIMVLPIEEAFVSLHAGTGFYSVGMAVGVVSFSPLLAGLIACANVQGDLSDKRYIFWRSKPASVKKLMALKFFVGLVLALVVIACPLIFGVVTSALAGEGLDDPFLKFYLPILILIALMTYSLCFGCNVLVRKTARAWLIGMLLAGFVLVFPFMLPLGFTDIARDIGMWAFGFYPAIILAASIAAFVFALYAAEHDWHLKTNLRELLCVGAALVFVLLMLFSSQVANIRVLDEMELKDFPWRRGALDKAGDSLIFQGLKYVDVGRKGISLREIVSEGTGVVNPPLYGNIGVDSEGHQIVYGPRVEGYMTKSYPRRPKALYKSTDDGMYCFGIISYYRREGEVPRQSDVHEKVYLRSYKLVGSSWRVVDELDISDLIGENVSYLRMAMRLIDNTLVVCVNRNLVVVDVTEPGDFEQTDKRLDVVQVHGHWSLRQMDRQEEFEVPIIAIERIGIAETIKLSVDLRYRLYDLDNDIYRFSMVDAYNDKIAFFSVSDDEIMRFDVIRRDEKTAYCKFSNSRPFTILEAVTGYGYTTGFRERTFVENGRLYIPGQNTLLVFDIRGGHGVRNLGHFVRMDWNISDVAALEDGRVLLYAWWSGLERGDSEKDKRYLYLLENPE